MNIQSEAERKHEEILSKYVSPRHGVLTKENALKAMRELEESLSPASPVREALEKIVRAWESLPGNKNYAPKEIERWLGDVMSPAIDAAREALAARTEGDGEDLRIKMLEEMKDWAMDAMDIGETGDEIKYSVNDFLADCDIWIERCKTTPFTP
jgi:hypothetical protein